MLATNAVDNGAGVEKAQPGECGQQAGEDACNLYLRRGSETRFVARLSHEDTSDWRTSRDRSSRVSPNGEWLAFMSDRPLTGYDNSDRTTGEPDHEVYLYHAPSDGEGKLLCPSCDPTGARPRGVHFGDEIGGPIASTQLSFKTPVAANVPVWFAEADAGTESVRQPRYLSDSGRLFFDSVNALAPQDANGTQDVYQYEPQAVGGCTAARPSFAQTSSGCVDLISSGASAKESVLLDASEDGNDVFILTNASLVAKDIDAARDVYDASVGGGEPQAVNPPACEGDACQQPVNPPNDPTPGSLTFRGAGNLHETKTKKHKTKKHAKKKHHKRHANKSRRASR